MKICFLISQNSALYSICKDALAQVTPYIELRMIGDDAAYQQAAAVHGIALVIVECTKYDRDNPAFRAALRKRLHVVQTDAAIPVIFADPKLQTGDEALPDSDTLVISPTASLDKWIQIISKALGVTETRLYHGDIDDIFEDFSIYDAPQVPNILSTEEFLKSAKPLEPHQFDIAISEAWTISEHPESTRKKSSALVQDISFNDDKMIAPAYRKSLVSQSHLKPIQPQFARAEAEKPSKPSLLDRLLKRHKSDAVQPAQSLKRLNSTPPPKVPRLIQPPKPPVPRPAAQIQQPSNPMLSSERVLPPANATGFNIEIGSIAEASVSVQNDVQAPMLSSEHVMPPEKATGFDIEIGNIAEQNTEAVPEMLDPEEFRPQDTAKFAIGGAFRRDTTENDAPGMLSENEIRKSFESESRFDFNVGGNFASSSNAANTKRSFAEMFSPEELLASAENLKVPFDFTVYPAGHPGFAEEIDDTSVDEWYEDDADFLPPFRLEDDDDFSTDLNVSPPQAHPSQDIAQQISAAVEASLTSVLRKLMTEELLPVIERRIDEKFEALKEHLAAQTLNIPKED